MFHEDVVLAIFLLHGGLRHIIGKGFALVYFMLKHFKC